MASSCLYYLSAKPSTGSTDQSDFRILFCFISDLAYWHPFDLLCLLAPFVYPGGEFACLFYEFANLWANRILIATPKSRCVTYFPVATQPPTTGATHHAVGVRRWRFCTPTAWWVGPVVLGQLTLSNRKIMSPIGSEINAHSSSPRRDIRRSEHRVQTDGVSKQINKQINGVSKQVNKQTK